MLDQSTRDNNTRHKSTQLHDFVHDLKFKGLNPVARLEKCGKNIDPHLGQFKARSLGEHLKLAADVSS
jgi:hypothetical protein